MYHNVYPDIAYRKAKEHQQGISWIMRKAISASTTTLKITQGSDEEGDRPAWAPTEWMMLEPALAGGLEGTPEKRQLTWTEFAHDDTLFGRVIIRSHYISGQRTADGRVRPLIEPFYEGCYQTRRRVYIGGTSRAGIGNCRCRGEDRQSFHS